MKIDEAIKYVEEIAELNEWFDKNLLESMRCKERAEEYRQLAEWLKELKQLREQTKRIPDKPDTWRIKAVANLLARHGLIVEQGSKTIQEKQAESEKYQKAFDDRKEEIKMLDGLYNGATMMGVRNIYDHMVLKDCYEAGLISEDRWKAYLNRLINITTKEDNNGSKNQH